MRYIKELREGENVVEHYLCKSKQSLKSRAGKTYLSLKLQDKTGTVDAKVWDMTNDIKAFEENEFIKIDATVVTYQNDIQLNVKRIRRSLEGEYDPADYIPCTEKNMEQAQPREPIQNEVSASPSPAKKTVQKKQPSKSLPDLSDFIIKESGRSAKNKTFYLDAAVIEAVHAAAEAQRITDSKLVNDILKKILQV